MDTDGTTLALFVGVLVVIVAVWGGVRGLLGSRGNFSGIEVDAAEEELSARQRSRSRRRGRPKATSQADHPAAS